MTRSQKQKPGEDAFFYYQVNETSPINYMYKAKIDGDHRLEFLLILFFHQGKKRRTVPRDNHIAKPMQSSVITIKDQPIFIETGLREYSQKQKPSKDYPTLSSTNETSPMDYMYKAKIDGDHRLDFLLILFFHQGKKRRTVPRNNHMAKLIQSSVTTIKDQPIFIQTGLREYSQKQKPGEDSHPRAKRHEKPGEDSYPRAKRYERLDEDSHSRAKRYGRLGGDSYPRAKRYEKPTEDSHPRAKRYEKPGKDSYPRVSMKQIPAKF